MTLFEKAQELYKLESQIKSLTDEVKKTVAPLEEQADILRAEVLAEMHEARLKSVRIEDGSSYQRVFKAKFDIVDETKATAWAKKNDCLRIDKTEANKLLLRLPKVPAGFAQNDVEHLRITRAAAE